MVPALGAGFTVTIVVADAVPQPLVTVYEIIAVPDETPVTTPVDPTVATPVVPELHEPPLPLVLNVLVPATHIFVVPVMVPALGAGLTAIVFTAKALPQPSVTV